MNNTFQLSTALCQNPTLVTWHGLINGVFFVQIGAQCMSCMVACRGRRVPEAGKYDGDIPASVGISVLLHGDMNA